MAKIEDAKFNGGVVDVDGNQFLNCELTDCEVRYSGGPPPSFIGCTFRNCRLGLGGASSNTIQYLRAIYRGFDEWGKGSVEQLFEDIRGAEQ